MLYAGRVASFGKFVAPHIVRLDRAGDPSEEIFGPILHVVTWRAGEFDALVAEIAASCYGLTMGLQARIEKRVDGGASRFPS